MASITLIVSIDSSFHGTNRYVINNSKQERIGAIPYN